MTVYKGIIAGIGDKNLGANIIKPEFDAKIYKFIIGKNCIIDGLNLNGNTLSPGMCVAEGYRGELKSPLTLDTTAYVYGVFKVNFDSDSLDEFYIETSTTKIIRQDDILHTSGTYYLLLYKNGAAQLSHNYPQNAVYADNTNHINDNGTLGKNVTAPTQPVNDNSTKVASAEYVHNQIKEEINYDIVELKVYSRGINNVSEGQVGILTLKRKAKYVIGVFDLTAGYGSNNARLYTDDIPNGFKPINTVYCCVQVQQTHSSPYKVVAQLLSIEANGKVSSAGTPSYQGSTVQSPFVTGWQTN